MSDIRDQLVANHFLDAHLYKSEQSRAATWRTTPSLDDLFDCLIDAARLYGIARAFSVVHMGSDAKTLNKIENSAAEYVVKAVRLLEARIRELETEQAKLRDQVATLEREASTTICTECQGIGTVQRESPFVGYANTIICPRCAGRGTVPNNE
jgi:DnaJ-class molecular chaperone